MGDYGYRISNDDVGIKSFSITRLKPDDEYVAAFKYAGWNQKFLDYEIETSTTGYQLFSIVDY